MDILGPSLLQLAERVAVIAAVLSAVALALCVFVRWSYDVRIKRAARFRREAEPLITAFLSGRAEATEVAEVLRRDPEEALLLLMELSDRLGPDRRSAMLPLFASLPLLGRETALLRHRRWEKRLRAAEYLGYLGDPSALPALQEALQDEVLAVRFAAARSLQALDGAESIEPILLAFDLPGEMNQRRVAEVLLEFGPVAADTLLEAAANCEGRYSDNVVDVAVRVLGMLRATKAPPVIRPLLQSPEFRVRLNAVRALSQIGDRAAIPDIARLIDDPSWEVRNAAVQALGNMRADTHQPLLVKSLTDPSWWVRHSAASALYACGDNGLEALRDAMRNSTDRFARDISRQILEEQRILETREKKS
jgi:HEAT repeat protein